MMYLIINEDRTPSTSEELTDEIMECVEAGIVDVYDLSFNPVKTIDFSSVWIEVEKFEGSKE